MALNERDILSRLSNPFIVNMHYCFQASTIVYYVLDLLNGDIYVCVYVCVCMCVCVCV